MPQPTYSFVIPLYNEEDNLPELYRQLSRLFESLDGDSELILVDDGSRDRSLAILRSLQAQDARVRYLSLGRNFGHQIALSAGLQFATGKAIVVMDADLQDPPEVVAQLSEQWRAGYDVVYGQRLSRTKEGWLKRLTAYGFYRLLNRLSDVEIPADTGDFCLMDRAVADLLNQMPERNRYIRGLRAWVGFRQTAVQFHRPGRFAGSVKYTFRKSLALAINSILGFSKIPLRLATYLGLFSAGFAGLMMVLTIYWRFFDRSPNSHRLEGFALITMGVFFLGAVQLICIGILGEYIGRIYEEVKGRPLFTIKELGGLKPLSNPHNTQTHAVPLAKGLY
ncbi:glycosyltransferase family 2 protein [Altericista sp. CCNU0014]|uniref:glycosyltransferase family 2 protein n=1 Tax=Altericista sp. CCNU0014 TaxID=3082949 RepID=UPI003850A364